MHLDVMPVNYTMCNIAVGAPTEGRFMHCTLSNSVCLSVPCLLVAQQWKDVKKSID